MNQKCLALADSGVSGDDDIVRIGQTLTYEIEKWTH